MCMRGLLLAQGRVFGNLREFVCADEVFLVEVIKSAVLAKHDFCRLFQVHFKKLQRSAAIVTFARMLFCFFLSHSVPTKPSLGLSELNVFPQTWTS